MSKIDPKTMSYEGCDLEAMSVASNYYDWLIDIIKKYVGKSVVEVGAGSGSFSRKLMKRKPQKLILVEPAKNMFAHLKDTVKEHASPKTKVVLLNDYMADAQAKIAKEKPDTFIYVNVFEHIEDDVKELRTIKDILPPGGHAVIFVPALQALFSNFDESIGHFRRYDRKMVEKLAKEAGMEVVHTRYMDIVGVGSWWVNFKLLKSSKLSPGMIELYDRHFIPFIRAVETRLPMPVGKNVLLIARKPLEKKTKKK